MLAVTFGRFPSEIVAGLSSSDLTELQAYYRMSPWGAQRDNYHSAQLSALLFNINRGKSQPKTVDDFMLKSQKQATQDKDNKLRAFLKAKADD